jgi:hypothetical protein
MNWTVLQSRNKYMRWPASLAIGNMKSNYTEIPSPLCQNSYHQGNKNQQMLVRISKKEPIHIVGNYGNSFPAPSQFIVIYSRLSSNSLELVLFPSRVLMAWAVISCLHRARSRGAALGQGTWHPWFAPVLILSSLTNWDPEERRDAFQVTPWAGDRAGTGTQYLSHYTMLSLLSSFSPVILTFLVRSVLLPLETLEKKIVQKKTS